MTREEAVARIKDHVEIHRCHERNAVKIFEALDMAIKALEQPEPCEDTISRQAAIAVADYADYTGLAIEDVKKVTGEVVKGLKQLPSAQPTYTDEEIQKMQDLEQAQIEKAYQLGYEEGKKDAQSEIIRCKDCKYRMPYDWMFSEVWRSQNMYDYQYNEMGCQYCDMSMTADDFCSRAERREEGEE